MCLQSQILSDIGIDEFAYKFKHQYKCKSCYINTNTITKTMPGSCMWLQSQILSDIGIDEYGVVFAFRGYVILCWFILVFERILICKSIGGRPFFVQLFLTKTRCISCNDCFVRKYLLASATPAIQLPSQLVWRFVFKCNYLSDNNTYQHSELLVIMPCFQTLIPVFFEL